MSVHYIRSSLSILAKLYAKHEKQQVEGRVDSPDRPTELREPPLRNKRRLGETQSISMESVVFQWYLTAIREPKIDARTHMT